MNLYTINTGFFKLDGGAMYGVVPKSIWSKLNPADENNMCTWSMRCLLIETSERLILIDNGIGNKQSDKFFGFYYLHGDDSLDKSLSQHGFHRDDITDVFLTHLHFDHCGGSITLNTSNGKYEPAFKQANYWTNREHWKWAVEPNNREKASFLKENILPIQECGRLLFVENEGELFPGFNVKFMNGHTSAMMIPTVNYKNHQIAFMADLIPSASHVPLPYIMSYDVRPLVTLDEKSAFLEMAEKDKTILFFEHDPHIECATLEQNIRGISVENTFKLSEL
jgi:glyoxylase-like metal-dependent hydrolase (beta-lactamase superfamily II)